MRWPRTSWWITPSRRASSPTYVVAATPSGADDEAFELAGFRIMAALRTGGVNVRSYLTTFRLDRAPGAPRTFSVTVQAKPQTAVSDPDGCQEFPPIINQPGRSGCKPDVFADAM